MIDEAIASNRENDLANSDNSAAVSEIGENSKKGKVSQEKLNDKLNEKSSEKLSENIPGKNSEKSSSGQLSKMFAGKKSEKEKEKEEKERIEKEKIERERIEKIEREKIEKERIEREKLENENKDEKSIIKNQSNNHIAIKTSRKSEGSKQRSNRGSGSSGSGGCSNGVNGNNVVNGSSIGSHKREISSRRPRSESSEISNEKIEKPKSLMSISIENLESNDRKKKDSRRIGIEKIGEERDDISSDKDMNSYNS